MTQRQQRIWTYLQSGHVGRDRGVPHRQLAAQLNILVTECRKPIGSHPRYGVYVCQDPADFEHACQCLADEVWPTLKRHRALNRLNQFRADEALAHSLQISLFEAVGGL